MKRLFVALAGLTLSASAFASGGHPLPFSFKPDTANLPSVQRGARDYMAYCSGCHSMKHLRYSRIAQDLSIPEDMVKQNLMFTTEKIGDHIISSMPVAQSQQWFGQAPPDLTLVARARGADWVYSYLNSFYVDETRPVGVNNLVLPGASMPHVLWELQGWQVKAAPKAEGEHAEAAGHGEAHGTGLELAQPGKLTPAEYKKFTGDLTNFMVYAAEPGRAQRLAMGPKVILYLLVLTFLFYALKKEFWKDIH